MYLVSLSERDVNRICEALEGRGVWSWTPERNAEDRRLALELRELMDRQDALPQEVA